MLHLLDILRQLVFPGQLEAERKVVDLLSWGQALVEVGLALRVRPQHVPIMPVRAHHTVELKNEADELGLALEHFVEAQLTLLGRWMVILVRATVRGSIHREVCLVIACILNFSDQRLVYFDRAAKLRLHHFEDPELDEYVVG